MGVRGYALRVIRHALASSSPLLHSHFSQNRREVGTAVYEPTLTVPPPCARGEINLVAETLVDSSLFFLALSFLASLRLAVRDFFSMDMRRSFLDPRHYTAVAHSCRSHFSSDRWDALHLAPVESVSHAVGKLTCAFSEHKREGLCLIHPGMKQLLLCTRANGP